MTTDLVSRPKTELNVRALGALEAELTRFTAELSPATQGTLNDIGATPHIYL